jgi:tetratricopeptide (TPR) repeat protein
MLIIIRLKLLVLLLFAASIASASKVPIDNSNCGIVSGQLVGGVDSYGYLDYINPADQSHLAKANQNYFRLPDASDPNAYPKNVTKPLRISPNHHQALYAMMNYYKGPRRDKHDEGKGYSMECYFKRANFHSPKDATVYMLHGMYYHWKSDWTNSEKQYLQASKLQPGDIQINYNLGLMYFEKGDYESAAKQARIAYDGGFPMEGLRRKLKKVNISVN